MDDRNKEHRLQPDEVKEQQERGETDRQGGVEERLRGDEQHQEEQTYYVQLGGEETLDRLVRAFYPRVYRTPELMPLFQGDMHEVMAKQKLFLTQFLGGPALYSMRYGPPRLRMRHLPFEITPSRAQVWLRCMREALDEIGLEGPLRDWFYYRLTQVADFMVNTEEASD